jgi:predicted CopG family antitoxin
MSTIITFSADEDTKTLLKCWAQEEDRSVSAVIRRLIERERNRRSTCPLSNDTVPKSAFNAQTIAKSQIYE